MDEKMEDYVDYEESPIRMMLDIKSELLPKYLWVLWIVITLIILLGMLFNLIDLENIDASTFLDSGITGLTFTLVIISAALEVFKEQELVKLIELETPKNKKGYCFLELLVPYVFTAVIFLVISLTSIIFPHVKIEVPIWMIKICNFIYINLLTMGVISIFNICYSIITHFYYAMRRRATIINDD